jgi:hypothetical protein
MTIESADRDDDPHGVASRLVDGAADRVAHGPGLGQGTLHLRVTAII